MGVVYCADRYMSGHLLVFGISGFLPSVPGIIGGSISFGNFMGIAISIFYIIGVYKNYKSK